MNYLLQNIIIECDDSPIPNEPSTLAEFQSRLNAYDNALIHIRQLAIELQKILDGTVHAHAAGTMVNEHIDTCAKCGKDIRDPVHGEN